jgi:hypothetical protein
MNVTLVLPLAFFLAFCGTKSAFAFHRSSVSSTHDASQRELPNSDHNNRLTPFLQENDQQLAETKIAVISALRDNHDSNFDLCNSHRRQQSRLDFLRNTVAASMAISTLGPAPTLAFDGGIGGLGKTKPRTGVQFFGSSGPMQSDKGMVTAEIQSSTGKPLFVSFQTPWPLLTGSGGLEARDLRNSESAFVQVVPLPTSSNWVDKKVFEQILLQSVLSSTGKFGAYGQPYNIQVKPIKNIEDSIQQQQQQLFSVTFTSLTPAMRESERKVWIQSTVIDNDTLVMLVVGTTVARFPANEGIIQKVVDSFEAVKAPESQLR